MRLWPIVFAAAFLAAQPGFAQQRELETSGPGKDSASSQADARFLDSIARDDAQPSQSVVVLNKHFQASGPVVHPFKARTIFEFPRRLFHLVNPFAKAEPKPEAPYLHGVSTRAWTTTVGWGPAASAFPDPVTHESSLGLLSLTHSK